MRARLSFGMLGAVALLFAACSENKVAGPRAKLAPAHIASQATGTSASGATLTTDKDDYLPGETLNLTGAGWPAGDVIAIHLDETPQNHAPVDWSIPADDNGGFTDGTYIIQESDLGVTFTITATSGTTGETAQATFTDAPAPKSPIDWTGNGTTGGACNAFLDDAKLTPAAGQQGWLFILTNDDPAFFTSDLTATFSDGTQGPIAGDKKANGSYHYIVYTAAGATLTSASATNGMTNSVLTVSHCELGGGVPPQPPTIGKTADGSYTNTYVWDIAKAVTSSSQSGGSATIGYTVSVTHDAGTISNVNVTGSITVTNPNAFTITGASVTDALRDGTVCSVTGGTSATLNTGNTSFSYTCSPSALPSGSLTNTATVTWPVTGALSAGSADFTTGSISFAETTVDGSVAVTDSYAGALGTASVGGTNPTTFTYSRIIAAPASGCSNVPNTASFTTMTSGATGSASQSVDLCTYTWNILKAVDKTVVKQIGGTATFNYTVTVSHDTPTIPAGAIVFNTCVNVTDSFFGSLGTVCVTDANPKIFTYARTISVPQFDCQSYPNTATFTTNGTGATGTASQTVRVCGPAKTGALTMGFWQNPNGQGIIKAGASTAGVCNSGTWLRGYAPFQNLSTTATCTQVASYVTTVIKAANASGAAMNAMLKGQMLATSLDVYFSNAALGGVKINAPAGPIGNVAIDLTKVCKNIGGGCTIFENVSSSFDGNLSMTVSAMLTYAASRSNVGGSAWYGQIKNGPNSQELAKDAFDAINNEKAFAP